MGKARCSSANQVINNASTLASCTAIFIYPRLPELPLLINLFLSNLIYQSRAEYINRCIARWLQVKLLSSQAAFPIPYPVLFLVQDLPSANCSLNRIHFPPRWKMARGRARHVTQCCYRSSSRHVSCHGHVTMSRALRKSGKVADELIYTKLWREMRD